MRRPGSMPASAAPRANAAACARGHAVAAAPPRWHPDATSSPRGRLSLQASDPGGQAVFLVLAERLLAQWHEIATRSSVHDLPKHAAGGIRGNHQRRLRATRLRLVGPQCGGFGCLLFGGLFAGALRV